MLPRVNSALLKFLKPIANSSVDSGEPIVQQKSEQKHLDKEKDKGKEQSKEQKDAKSEPHPMPPPSPQLKLATPPQPTPEQAPTPPEAASFAELVNALNPLTRLRTSGPKIYTETINRLKKIGATKKGVILDERAE